MKGSVPETEANGTEARTQRVNAEGRNRDPIHCKRCSSLILRSDDGVFINLEVELPLVMAPKGEGDGPSKEKLSTFWQVDDIFTFENMGFTKTVDKTKYLACAECDAGPLGYHDPATNKSFLSLDRVHHKSS
jgi:DNA-directed RNA polymerase subunit RPC12/RpoP